MPGKPYCPVPGPLDGPDYSLTELDPLLEQLRSPQPVAGRYPVGTLCPDGRLDLCKQSLGLAGVRLLPSSPAILSLLLGTNGLGDAGVAEVARLIRINPQLSTLYLGCNYIGKEGAEVLGQALAEVGFAGAVWLKRNPLGDSGSQALSQALRRGFAPRCLDLEQCQLGRSGVVCILEALVETGCPIRRLSLAGNDLGPELVPDLQAFLRECPSLRALQLGSNRLAGLAPGGLHELGLASNGLRDEHLDPLLGGQLRELDLGVARPAGLLGAPSNQFTAAGLAKLAPGQWERLLLDPRDLDRVELPEGVSRSLAPPMWWRRPRQSEDPDLAAVRSHYRTVR